MSLNLHSETRCFECKEFAYFEILEPVITNNKHPKYYEQQFPNMKYLCQKHYGLWRARQLYAQSEKTPDERYINGLAQLDKFVRRLSDK